MKLFNFATLNNYLKHQFESSKIKNLNKTIKNLQNKIHNMSKHPSLIADVIKVGDSDIILQVNDSQIRIEKDWDLSPGDQVCVDPENYEIRKILPKEKPVDLPLESWDNIGGLKTEIRKVTEAIELPLLHPEKFQEVGISPPTGVLLVGPPGTGKTLIAKAVAHETKAHFEYFAASEFALKFVGDGAAKIRKIFEKARQNQPCILFIDEIDAIAGKRDGETFSSDQEINRTLMQLLTEMDGFNALDKVKILGATNRPDILDPAILRPGRFDRIVSISYPSQKDIIEIFKIHTKKMNCKAVNFEEISELLPRKMTGAEIKLITFEAGMSAIRNNRTEVIKNDFIYAIDEIYRNPANAKSKPMASISNSPYLPRPQIVKDTTQKIGSSKSFCDILRQELVHSVQNSD